LEPSQAAYLLSECPTSLTYKEGTAPLEGFCPKTGAKFSVHNMANLDLVLFSSSGESPEIIPKQITTASSRTLHCHLRFHPKFRLNFGINKPW
jgi:hypothetical protein